MTESRHNLFHEVVREAVSIFVSIARFVRPSLWIIAGASIYVIISFLFVELVVMSIDNTRISDRPLWFNLSIATWLCLCIIILTIGIGAIVSAFARREREVLLSRIIFSYFSLVFMFTGLYYSMSCVYDRNDALHKYVHYRHESQLLRSGLRTNVRILKERRAFKGIQPRLWSGVDWPIRSNTSWGGSPPDDFDIDATDMIAAARQGQAWEVVKFAPEFRLAVFADCLHFSIVTMATLGYGDIVPHSQAAKLASDLQVISGVILLVIAFGLAVGNKNIASNPSKNSPRDRFISVLGWTLLLLLACFLIIIYIRSTSSREREEHARWLMVSREIDSAIRSSPIINVNPYAEESLELASRHRTDWNYGNAIHESNIALGLYALEQGDVNRAKLSLLAAGSTPGSPQLDNFGPNMHLANELLKRGERQTVLQYLDLCRLFWKDKDLLRKAIDLIERGTDPNLEALSVGIMSPLKLQRSSAHRRQERERRGRKLDP